MRQQNESQNQAKLWIFAKIFNFEFNIAFGYPRSDICETCEQNAVQQKEATQENDQVRVNQLQTAHNHHLRQAENFYTAMSNETISALDDDVACLCFDFEKNLPLPVTNVTKEFFSRQLWIHNFGVHNLRGGESAMYIYSESYCQKGPNEVISSLKHYFDNFLPRHIRKLQLFSDNSGGQNKNKYVLAFLSSLHDQFEEITFSLPIVGHSRMPVDRDFAHIEQLKRKQDKFHFPSDWTNLIHNAQNVSSFQVVFLEHPLTDDLVDDGTPIADVFDYKSAVESILGPPAGIMSRKSFRFDDQGSITSRISTSGPHNLNFQILKPWASTNLLKQNIRLVNRAYNAYIPLTKAKFDNIQDLLKNVFIPPEKVFYDHLERSTQNRAADDELEAILDDEED